MRNSLKNAVLATPNPSFAKEGKVVVPNEPFTLLWIDRLSLACFVGLFLLSTIVFGCNYFYWHYPMVNYFWTGMDGILGFLFFSTLGCYFSKGPSSRWTQTFFYLTVYHSIVLLLMYATTAVQLTPFEPIDAWLLQVDRVFHYDSLLILKVISKYPWLRQQLTQFYNFIDFELFILPAVLMVWRQFYSVKQYFFLLLSTTLIGYIMYYFWPTMAPASVLQSVHFSVDQQYTGFKFYLIHHYVMPSSEQGGLISMPSFHIIWAFLCQHSARHIRWLWYGLLPMNMLVIISALFLGWHYLADLWGSILVIMMASGLGWIYRKRRERRLPV